MKTPYGSSPLWIIWIICCISEIVCGQIAMPVTEEINLFGSDRFDTKAITRIYSANQSNNPNIAIFARRLYLGSDSDTQDNLVYSQQVKGLLRIMVFVDELIIDRPVRLQFYNSGTNIQFIANKIRIGPHGVLIGNVAGGNANANGFSGVFAFSSKEIHYDESIQPPLQGLSTRKQVLELTFGAAAATTAMQSSESQAVVSNGIRYRHAFRGAILLSNTGFLSRVGTSEGLQQNFQRAPDLEALFGIMEVEAMRQKAQPITAPLQFAENVYRASTILDKLVIPSRKDLLARREQLMKWVDSSPNPLKLEFSGSPSPPPYWFNVKNQHLYSSPNIVLVQLQEGAVGLLMASDDSVKIQLRGRLSYQHQQNEIVINNIMKTHKSVQFGGVFTDWDISGAQLVINNAVNASANLNINGDAVNCTLEVLPKAASMALLMLRSDGGAELRFNYRCKGNAGEMGSLRIPFSLSRWDASFVKLISNNGKIQIRNDGKRAVRVDYVLLDGKVHNLNSPLEIPPTSSAELGGIDNLESLKIPPEAVRVIYDNSAKTGLSDLHVVSDSNLVRTFQLKNWLPLDHDEAGRLQRVECSIIFSEKGVKPGEEWSEHLEGPVSLAASGALGSEQNLTVLVNPGAQWRVKLTGTAYYGERGKNMISINSSWTDSTFLNITTDNLKLQIK